MIIKLNGKLVDENTIQVWGRSASTDYPDFSDAYAKFETGEDLTEHELDKLGLEYSELLNEMTHASLR